ncbi:recombinase RecT [Arsenophonus nasoniae]
MNIPEAAPLRRSRVACYVRKQKAVYMPMVDGVIKRARQSGQVANIIAKVVYAQDEFEYVIDENGEHLTHRPSFVDGDEIVKVYAFAKLNSGELVVEVMSRADVEKIRDTVQSAKYDSSPWVKWFDRMALKTVIHRLARRLPCASELFLMLEVYEGCKFNRKTA